MQVQFVKMRSSEWAPIQYAWRSYKKKGNLDADMHTVRVPGEDEGRERGDLSTSQ